ncbi:MAG: PorP/SprF family type IX secretion system membrane protein [Ferruginibacter sp.]
MRKRILPFLLLLVQLNSELIAQDPHFTQNGTASALINPANSGVFLGNVRFGSIYRHQWSSLGSPLTSMLFSVDAKLSSSHNWQESALSAGLVFQSDKSLKGAVSSNALSFNAAYHVPLNQSGNQTLGLGLIGTYGKMNFNLNQLAAGSQFTSGGFNLSLPSGEVAYENMRPYFSMGAGLLFVNNNPDEGTFFELGVAAYHLNRPQKNILYEGSNPIPVRLSAQANLQRYLGENLLMDVRLLYQSQAASDYLQGSLSVAKLLEDDPDGSLVGLGLAYRTSDAVSPFVFTELNAFRLGFSYDFQINDITKSNITASSLELSLQYRIKSR